MKWFENAADVFDGRIRIVTTDDAHGGHGYFETEFLNTADDVRAYIEHIRMLAKQARMKID